MYLLLLVVAWAVVLVPPIAQRLMAGRPSPRTRDPLAALARRHRAGPATAKGPVATTAAPEATASSDDALVPRTATEAQQRRRLIAGALGVMALVTAMLIPALGPAALLAHALVDGVLVGFGYLWWQRNQTPDAATASVVAISSLRATSPQPARAMVPVDLPRVVNG